MKAIELTEIETGDIYYFPLCNIAYYSINNKENHLFIMMSDGRNKTTYKLSKYYWGLIDL